MLCVVCGPRYHGSTMGEPAAKTPPSRRATYDDILAAPDHLVAEIVDGELFTSPRPASRHARSASVICSDILGPFDRTPGDNGGPGGWWILVEPELHLHDAVLVPDLAGWKRTRMPNLPDTPACELPPDWVCEVVSPHTASLDKVKKMRIYAREHVAHIWLVDPIARTLDAYILEGSRWILLGTHAGSDHARITPFTQLRWISRASGSTHLPGNVLQTRVTGTALGESRSANRSEAE